MTEADQTPAKRYFTGKPCKRGHVAERYTATRTCVMCAAERCLEWQATNKRKYLDAQGEARRVRLFDVSRAKYDAMLAAQGGGCAICGGANRRGRLFAVDHDHACCPGARTCGKCVRGLLCDACNHGLGNFRDNTDILKKAISYLQE